MLTPPGDNLFHQTEGETTTPLRARVVTIARSSHDPRSLKARTRAPSSMPRAAASVGCSSRKGDLSFFKCFGRFAKLEFRKACDAGLISANGYLLARSGALLRDSFGGTKSGTAG